MEPILEVEEGAELVSSLFDNQVFDYRQWEITTAELRVHIPIIKDESPFVFLPGFGTRNPRLTQWELLGTIQPFS